MKNIERRKRAHGIKAAPSGRFASPTLIVARLARGFQP
jgi:hypothetical protein